jgi:hypothetical protein
VSVRIQWTGRDEFMAALRALPEELTGEASHIVEAAVNGAEAEIRSGYPAGELRDGLTVTRTEGRFSTGAILRSKAFLAWIWENGSEARHYLTVRGHTHDTGSMWGRRPPPHTFKRAVMRKRRQMYAALKDLLVRHGLLVSGDA